MQNVKPAVILAICSILTALPGCILPQQTYLAVRRAALENGTLQKTAVLLLLTSFVLLGILLFNSSIQETKV